MFSLPFGIKRSNPSAPSDLGQGATAHKGGKLAHMARSAFSGNRLVLLKSFFVALTFTAVFYEVFPLPMVGPGRLFAIFDSAVSESIVVLATWALFFLTLQGLRYRNEAKAFRISTAPQHLSVVQAVDPSGLAGVLKRAGIREPDTTLMARRLAAVTRTLGRHDPDPSVLQSNLQAQADIDGKRLDLSYAPVHVFIWAIPILGFIGTVVGIGDAIVEFSRFVQSVDPSGMFGAQMREALGGVTTGLAIAFNTTFLALALSVPVMLGASLLQKSEEELLLALDEFFLWEFGTSRGAIARSAGAASATQADLEAPEWVARAERAAEQFAQQADLAQQQLAGVQPLIKDFTDRLLDAPAKSTPSPAAISDGDGPSQPTVIP